MASPEVSILGKVFIDTTEPTDVFGDPSPKHDGKQVHRFPHPFPIYKIKVNFVDNLLAVKICTGRLVSSPLIDGLCGRANHLCIGTFQDDVFEWKCAADKVAIDDASHESSLGK